MDMFNIRPWFPRGSPGVISPNYGQYDMLGFSAKVPTGRDPRWDPHVDHGTWGRCISCPSGVWGRARAADAFLGILSSQNTSQWSHGDIFSLCVQCNWLLSVFLILLKINRIQFGFWSSANLGFRPPSTTPMITCRNTLFRSEPIS